MPRIEKVAQVLPGHRVEIVVPELDEGVLVNVVVEPFASQSTSDRSIVAFLDSLPDGPRALPTWPEYEQHLRQESNAWDPWRCPPLSRPNLINLDDVIAHSANP